MRKGLYEPVRTPDSPTSVDSESDDDDVLSPVAKEAADERMLSEDEDNEMEDPQEDPQPNKENAPAGGFEIRPPRLSMEQRKEYVLYNENDIPASAATPALPRRFEVRPPTLSKEQRREYVAYEEDDEGNLL